MVLSDPVRAVGACYPCGVVEACIQCTNHYMGTDRQQVIKRDTAWKCPGIVGLWLASAIRKTLTPRGAGGTAPPENCRSRNFMRSPDSTECACKAGLFPSGMDCMPCPAGHMCPNGTKLPCNKHFYQPADGATSCLQCGTSGDQNSFFRCIRKGTLLRFCDPDRPSTQDRDLMSNCVPCQQCRRSYTDSASQADPKLSQCYRDGT